VKAASAFVVVGDIHGRLDKLEKLLANIGAFRDRTAVFLGDYVDVGPHSYQVINRLIRFQEECPESIFMLGNHDYGMLQYMEGGNFSKFAAEGGIPTIVSYCGTVRGDPHLQFIRAVPAEHITFLRNLRPFFETSNYFLSHSGLNPRNPEDRSFEAIVLGSYEELFSTTVTIDKTVICGHYYQRGCLPFLSDKFICIDTGCGILPEGRLTALLLPERSAIQV
jgi:serine/threonine protein phosphatase 1